MDLFSRIDLPKSSVEVSYDDRNMLFGSCFAESIGNMFIEHHFQVDLNPFGILYNPESIALAITRLLENKKLDNEELFFYDGLYHSFEHHGSFSSISKESCLQKINNRLASSADNFLRASKLFITFGTSYVYRLKETEQTVANCHKLPAKLFVRERLSMQQIVVQWAELLIRLFDMNRDLIVFFTVSPVRYWQDGVHENQISKSILLLAIEALQTRFPERIVYFPAYELMMDELRDYRFYAEDLFHPSDTAIQHIWERFTETYMNKQTLQLLREVNQIQKALNHKPLNPNSESYKHFLSHTLNKIEQLNEKMPFICFEKEKGDIKFKIQRIEIRD